MAASASSARPSPALRNELANPLGIAFRVSPAWPKTVLSSSNSSTSPKYSAKTLSISASVGALSPVNSKVLPEGSVIEYVGILLFTYDYFLVTE